MPLLAAYWPSSHKTGACDAEAQLSPIGHTVHDVCPAELKVTFPHGTGAAVTDGHWNPAGQTLQTKAPAVVVYVPAGHAWHSLAAVAALAVPASQSVQVEDWTAAYWPAPQGSGADVCGPQ